MFNMLLPVYNVTGANEIIKLKNYITDTDTIIVSNGIFTEINMDTFNQVLALINTNFPNNETWICTGGLHNLCRLKSEVTGGFNAFLWGYEKDIYNPCLQGLNFDYNFEWTKAMYQQAKLMCGPSPCYVKVTGLPIMRDWAQQYGWNYNILHGLVDGQNIMTQAYCKTGEHGAAIDVLLSQGLAADDPSWQPHISLLPTEPNGVDVDTAINQCVKSLTDRGVNRSLIWWHNSTDGAIYLRDFIIRMNR